MPSFFRSCTIAGVFLALLAGGGAAMAQTFNVRTLSLRAGEMPEVFVKKGKKYQLLKFSHIQPTRSVQADAVNPLPLYGKVMSQKGKEGYRMVQKIKLPAGGRGILLLGWTVEDKARYVAIKDDFASASFDDWLLINTTKKKIAFKAGEKTKPILIAPGKAATCKITLEKNKGVAVLAQAPFEGKAKVFFSTYWPVRPGKRTLALFVEDGRKIRVKRISDALARGPEREE